MQRYADWYRDSEGRGYPGAIVTVYNAGTSDKPQLYNAGGSISSPAPISNPTFTDSNGYFAFAVPNGTYDIHLQGGGMPATIIPNVSIGTTDVTSIDASDITYDLGVTGSEVTTESERNAREVWVTDFMNGAQKADVAAGTALVDVTDAFLAAMAYAKSLTVSGTDYTQKGGIIVRMTHGSHRCDLGPIEIPQGVGLAGSGKWSTAIVSAFDGQVLRNEVTTGIGNYDKSGLSLRDFSVVGDRTKTNQVCIDLLRPICADIRNIGILNSGGNGINYRQALMCETLNLEVAYCVGHGLQLDGGINFWADPTPNGYPSNASTFVNYHGFKNDGAGLRFAGYTNGNVFLGGAIEYNYWSSGNNVGYNILVNGTTFMPNELNNVWSEGPAQAHLYIDLATATSLMRVNGFHHFGGGSSGSVDRAIILNKGIAFVAQSFGHGDSYKSFSGSVRPFTINLANSAIMYVTDARGSTITDGLFCEDTSHVITGLQNNAYQINYGVFSRQADFKTESGQETLRLYKNSQTTPWCTFQNFDQSIRLGSGSATADVSILRTAANVGGVATGDSWKITDGTWDGGHFILGAYHLWVSAGGKLYIKSGAPASDTDGTIVGTQS